MQTIWKDKSDAAYCLVILKVIFKWADFYYKHKQPDKLSYLFLLFSEFPVLFWQPPPI